MDWPPERCRRPERPKPTVDDEERILPNKYHTLAMERMAVFCNLSTMHGMQFLIKANNPRPIKRWIWACVVVASYGFVIVFSREAISDFVSSTVQINLEMADRADRDLTFPSVTVCNQNQISASILAYVLNRTNNSSNKARLVRNLKKYLYTGTKVGVEDEDQAQLEALIKDREIVKMGMIINQMRDSINWVDQIDEVLKEIPEQYVTVEQGSPDTVFGMHFMRAGVIEPGNSQILGVCYRGRWKDGLHSTEFLPFLLTDAGYCTLIKPQTTMNCSLDKKSWAHKFSGICADKGVELGRDGGLRLFLDSETYNYGYSKHGKDGFVMAVHHHRDMPFADYSGIQADPGSITNVMVHSTAVATTPEALNRFNRQARGCVTESEFQLKYLPYPNARYSVSNCILSAKVESVVNSCQCWPPFFHGWQQKPLDRGDIKPCMGAGIFCAKRALKAMEDENTASDVNNVRQSCDNPCFNEYHEVSSYLSKWYDVASFAEEPALFCPLFDKLRRDCALLPRVVNTTRSWRVHRTRLLRDRYPQLCQLLNRGHPSPAPCQTSKSNKSLESALDARTKDSFCSRYSTSDCTSCRFRPVVEEDLAKFRRKGFVCKDSDLECLMYEYASANVAVVNLHFSSTKVFTLTRNETARVITFLAIMGGILGLVQGTSFVTCIDTGQSLFEAATLWFKQFRHRGMLRKIDADPALKVRKHRNDLARRLNDM